MNVSPKFLLLIQQLEAHQILGNNFRGVVFGELDGSKSGCYNININIYSPETDCRSTFGRFDSKLNAATAIPTSSIFDESLRLL
jgi:hypothetical protein